MQILNYALPDILHRIARTISIALDLGTTCLLANSENEKLRISSRRFWAETKKLVAQEQFASRFNGNCSQT